MSARERNMFMIECNQTCVYSEAGAKWLFLAVFGKLRNLNLVTLRECKQEQNNKKHFSSGAISRQPKLNQQQVLLTFD